MQEYANYSNSFTLSLPSSYRAWHKDQHVARPPRRPPQCPPGWHSHLTLSLHPTSPHPSYRVIGAYQVSGTIATCMLSHTQCSRTRPETNPEFYTVPLMGALTGPLQRVAAAMTMHRRARIMRCDRVVHTIRLSLARLRSSCHCSCSVACCGLAR